MRPPERSVAQSGASAPDPGAERRSHPCRRPATGPFFGRARTDRSAGAGSVWVASVVSFTPGPATPRRRPRGRPFSGKRVSVLGSSGPWRRRHRLQGARTAERVWELLDTRAEVADAPGAVALPRVRGHLRFERVSFGYDEGVPVLREVELEVAPGEVVALVGSSGAGKSTLMGLIPRFFDPTAGRVLVDGHDLRGVRVASLREQVALVSQDVQLFHDSVRENIRYGRLDATDAEVVEAARAANAHDFVMALPGGYDAPVGERGVKLSGGQRQRISIARALLRGAPILLLDEATSALDSESETLVKEALERLMQGRTKLIVAHRLATVRDAHRILVMEGGRIVEEGTHAELARRRGLYSRLAAHQSTTV